MKYLIGFLLGLYLGSLFTKTIIVTDHSVIKDCVTYNKLFGGMPWKEVCR